MDRRLPGDEDRLAPDRDVTVARDELRPLSPVALAALVPFALLAVAARLAPVASWELDIVLALAVREGPWAHLVGLVNTIGNLLAWAVLVLVLALVLARLRGTSAALLVGFSFAADLAAFAVKLLVERARPETLASEHLVGADTFAFPSGHVVRAVALAAAVAWLVAPPGRRLSLAIGAALVAGLVMGYARIALGAHWPTDVVGGLLLGIGWFAVTARILPVLSSRLARGP